MTKLLYSNPQSAFSQPTHGSHFQVGPILCRHFWGTCEASTIWLPAYCMFTLSLGLPGGSTFKVSTSSLEGWHHPFSLNQPSLYCRDYFINPTWGTWCQAPAWPKLTPGETALKH